MPLEYCKNGLNTDFLPRFQNKILCMEFTLELSNNQKIRLDKRYALNTVYQAFYF